MKERREKREEREREGQLTKQIRKHFKMDDNRILSKHIMAS